MKEEKNFNELVIDVLHHLLACKEPRDADENKYSKKLYADLLRFRYKWEKDSRKLNKEKVSK